MKNVSIIMPIYWQDREIVKKIDEVIKKQVYPGKVKVIKVDKNLGLADSLNYGIKKAKTEIVISLHQDCIPASNDWLRKLVKPLENNEVVASVSKVELGPGLWNNFDAFAKILSVKEQRVLQPWMDEKGCAYKKSVLLKLGLFDGKTFRTAGEDFDMWFKLKEAGEIAYPGCKVMHMHKHTFKNRIKKELQLSNGFGALVRIYKTRLPKWYIGMLKAIPLIGWPLFLYGLKIKKLRLLSLVAVPLYLLVNLVYSYGFWKGFLIGKETI